MTTDLLIKPEDTGEIPRVGERTENLKPYLHLPPAMRRPTVVLNLIEARGGCRRMDTDDPEEFEVVTTPAPPPAPKPTVDDRPLSGGEEVLWSYEPVEPLRRGRHRRPSRWDWLTVPLGLGAQVIRRAWAKGDDL